MFVIIQQMLAFTLVAALGYAFGKKGVIRPTTAQDISRILMSYILVLVVIRSFLRPFDAREALTLFQVFTLSLLILFMHIAFARLVYGAGHPIDRYAVIFNNKGFIAIPMVSVMFSESAVFYVTPTIIATNLFIWTYGQRLLGREGASLTWKKLLLNPSTVGFMLGLGLYVLPIRLPESILSAIGYLTALNTPLAMLLLGYFMSLERPDTMFREIGAWRTSFYRLIAVPIAVVFMLMLWPFGDKPFRLVMAITWASPVAMNLSLQTSMNGLDTGYAARITSLSTLLSPLTIPVIYAISDYLL